MPVILPEDRIAQWLGSKSVALSSRDSGVSTCARKGKDDVLREPQDDTLQSLLAPYPASDMEAYPVSAIVNSPRNDSEECARPVEQRFKS